MIHYDYEKIKTENEINTNFISAIRQLKLSKLLNQCGILKTARTLSGEHSCEKRTAFEIFQFLILMAFQGTSLFRFLGSKCEELIAWYISRPAFIRLLCAEDLNSVGIPIGNHI